MIRPFLKVMQALRPHLPNSSEKPESALGDKNPQPTAPSPANSPTTGNSDPHMLANIYLGEHGKDKGRPTLRFYHGQYWRWKNLRYQVIGKDELRAEVTRTVKHEFDEQAARGGPTNRRPMHVTCSLITNVLQAVSSITAVHGDLEQPVWLKLDGHKYMNLVSMANGSVDLDELLEGKPSVVRPPSPEWFATVTLPYGFDPDASCSKWLEFLGQVLEGDEQRIRLIQEWFGYCATSNTSEQKFLVMEGEGANGKSVVCEILAAMLGEDNVSHVPLEVFGERFQLTATRGKLANIAPEVGELKSVAEGFLKQFTSGERMYFDRKGLAPIHERPTARLVLAANNRPHFSDRSSGLLRRMLVMPFRVSVSEEHQDKNLPQKLRAELPGIFNWAVQGERRRREQGGFTKSQVCSEALGEYRLEISPARLFLTEQVELDPAGIIPSGQLYTAYRQWCDTNGNKALTAQSFGREVKRHFPDIGRERETSGERRWRYHGLRLRDHDGDADGPATGGPPGSPRLGVSLSQCFSAS